MTQRMTQWLAIGAAALGVAACASQPPVTSASPSTSTTTTTSSGGDVAMAGDDDMGMGMGMGMREQEMRTMSNANIVAHLATGDSLEVALSQAGADRAQNSAVRDYARRMVSEHTAHMQMGMQMATQGGIAPMASPADTADRMMATRVMGRLASATQGQGTDRQIMRAELMMHRHMLHELQMVRPQATGAAQQLVDQTIPVVQRHLADAQALYAQIGGRMDGMNDMRHDGMNGTNGTNGSAGSSGSGGSTGGGTTPP